MIAFAALPKSERTLSPTPSKGSYLETAPANVSNGALYNHNVAG